MMKSLTIAAVIALVPAWAPAGDRALSIAQTQIADVVPKDDAARTIAVGALLDRPNATYSVGEAVNLTVTTDRDAYVTVFAVSPDGTTAVLFPNRVNPDNRVPANTPVPVPGKGARIEVGGPVGRELIKIVASEQPLPLPDLGDFQTAGDFQATNPAGSERVARQLTVISEPAGGAATPGLGAWGTAEMVLTTVEKAAVITATPVKPATALPAFSIVMGTDRPSYKVGDAIAFTLQSSRDCHLTLLNFGASGKAAVLFPAAPGQANRIAAGVPVRVPGQGSTGALIASGPAGNETVLAVCSTDKRRVVAADGQLSALGRSAMTSGALGPRDIDVLLTPGQTGGQLAQTSISFAVTP